MYGPIITLAPQNTFFGTRVGRSSSLFHSAHAATSGCGGLWAAQGLQGTARGEATSHLVSPRRPAALLPFPAEAPCNSQNRPQESLSLTLGCLPLPMPPAHVPKIPHKTLSSNTSVPRFQGPKSTGRNPVYFCTPAMNTPEKGRKKTIVLQSHQQEYNT